MTLVRTVVLVVAVLGALCGSGRGEGTPAPWSVGVSDAQKAQANRLLARGNALFLEKKFAEALAEYRDAVAAWDHPAIRFNIVRCLIQLDRPVEAAENLRTSLRYGAAPLEDAVYTEAVAYEKLLRKQVADLSISCKQAGVTVSLDGKPLTTCPGVATQRVSPGKHQLLGTADGLLPRAQELVLVGGESQAIEVTLLPIPKSTSGLRPRSLGKAALIGGGGLVVVAGGLAIWAWRSYHAPFPDHCTASPSGGRPLCDTTGADDVDRARLVGNVATVIGGVGLAAVVTGALVMARYPRTERTVTVTAAGDGATVAVGGRF